MGALLFTAGLLCGMALVVLAILVGEWLRRLSSRYPVGPARWDDADPMETAPTPRLRVLR
jgi:hypothetical protein